MLMHKYIGYEYAFMHFNFKNKTNSRLGGGVPVLPHDFQSGFKFVKYLTMR
jgi:hypothetical protein